MRFSCFLPLAATLLLSGCGGRPLAEVPLAAGEAGVTLRVGEPEMRWCRLGQGRLPVSQVRVGVVDRGTTNWSIVLWDGVWKNGWSATPEGATTQLFRVSGKVAAPAAGSSMLLACTIGAPLRVRSRLGEGFVPAGTHVVPAAAAADGRRWSAGLPVVVSVPSTFTNGWFGRQRLSRQEEAEEACFLRKDRLETRILYLNPELRTVIRKVNAELIARQSATQTVHEIQVVLSSHGVTFPPGGFVTEGPFTNSLLVRTTVAELNTLDPIRGKGGVILFGPYDPWLGGLK